MNRTLIKFSKVVFDVLFWLGMLVLVALVVVSAFVPMLVDLAVENGEQFSFGFLGAQIDVDLSEMEVDSAAQFGWAALLALTSALAVWTYVSHQIRRALGAALEGSAFRSENYGRLRRIAYAVFILIPFGIISQSWMDTITHGSFQLAIDLQLGTLAIGLLALSVAEIYKAGITLQDEAELTV